MEVAQHFEVPLVGPAVTAAQAGAWAVAKDYAMLPQVQGPLHQGLVTVTETQKTGL